MSIFVAKMVVSIAPMFTPASKILNAVISQEQETKSEKDDAEKDSFKEKKIFDETCLHFVDYQVFAVVTTATFNRGNWLYHQAYHPSVPTPPPNV